MKEKKWTHLKIRKSFLERLRVISKKTERSMPKQLEHWITKEEKDNESQVSNDIK